MSEQVTGFITQATQSIQSGQFNEALEMANQAIMLDSSNAEAYLLRAIAQSQTNQPEAATQSFMESIRLAPESPKAHFNLAVHYYQQGKKDLALESAKGAINADPNHPGARDLVQRIEQELGLTQTQIPGNTAENPYATPNAAYMRNQGTAANYSSNEHSVAFVENMGAKWVTLGWGLIASSIVLFIISMAMQGSMLMQMFSDPEGFNRTSSAMGMSASSIFMSIVSMILKVCILTWTALDIADRRGNWVWMVPQVLCCCCGLEFIPMAIYIAAGRK